jgi:hypothetical protein
MLAGSTMPSSIKVASRRVVLCAAVYANTKVGLICGAVVVGRVLLP